MTPICIQMTPICIQMTPIWIQMTPICVQMTPICFQMTPIGGWQITGWGLLVGFGVTVMDPEPPTWEIICSGNFPGFWPCVLRPGGSPCTCRGCSASWCPCPRTPSWVLCQFCHTEKKGNDQPLAQLTLVVLVAGHNCLLTPWLQMYIGVEILWDQMEMKCCKNDLSSQNKYGWLLAHLCKWCWAIVHHRAGVIRCPEMVDLVQVVPDHT